MATRQYHTQSHYPDIELTSSCPNLIMPTARVGDDQNHGLPMSNLLAGDWGPNTGVLGVMEMGKIVPGAGFERTLLPCSTVASVLTVLLPMLPYSMTLSIPIQFATWLCDSLPEREVQTTTLFALELQVF